MGLGERHILNVCEFVVTETSDLLSLAFYII